MTRVETKKMPRRRWYASGLADWLEPTCLSLSPASGAVSNPGFRGFECAIAEHVNKGSNVSGGSAAVGVRRQPGRAPAAALPNAAVRSRPTVCRAYGNGPIRNRSMSEALMPVTRRHISASARNGERPVPMTVLTAAGVPECTGHTTMRIQTPANRPLRRDFGTATIPIDTSRYVAPAIDCSTRWSGAERPPDSWGNRC